MDAPASMDATVTTGTGSAAAAAAAIALAQAQDVPMPDQNQRVADGDDEDPVTSAVAEGAVVEAAAAAAAGKGPGDAAKCAKCLTRYGKSTCSQLACMKCCTDIDGCEGHRAMREEKRRQEEILDGTSAVNVRAAKQRRMTVTPGAFPGEPAFRYLQESLIVWDCRQYLDNPKWREDAIRRSERNKRAREVFAGGAGKAEEKTFPKKKEGRKRRFQRIMTELYDASVKV